MILFFSILNLMAYIIMKQLRKLLLNLYINYYDSKEFTYIVIKKTNRYKIHQKQFNFIKI